MAAVDNFAQFNASLPEAMRKAVEGTTQQAREGLLAARSEDARNRIVEEYIRLVRELQEKEGRRRQG